MQFEGVCPICEHPFVRKHLAHYQAATARFCSRACANKAPGRMTPEIRARISRPGETHPRWKGGWRSEGGYVHIGNQGLRSHHVWNQAHPDDPVQPGEVIHHLNEIKDDDRPENLHKFASQSEHWKHHAPDIAARRTRDTKGRFI